MDRKAPIRKQLDLSKCLIMLWLKQPNLDSLLKKLQHCSVLPCKSNEVQQKPKRTVQPKGGCPSLPGCKHHKGALGNITDHSEFCLPPFPFLFLLSSGCQPWAHTGLVWEVLKIHMPGPTKSESLGPQVWVFFKLPK